MIAHVSIPSRTPQATALLLAAMRDRSFVVATAYAKTEAVQAAIIAMMATSDSRHIAP